VAKPSKPIPETISTDLQQHIQSTVERQLTSVIDQFIQRLDTQEAHLTQTIEAQQTQFASIESMFQKLMARSENSCPS
jgi:NAD-specific glutamate dehydrogenase